MNMEPTKYWMQEIATKRDILDKRNSLMPIETKRRSGIVKSRV
jgi:hypothetical protein